MASGVTRVCPERAHFRLINTHNLFSKVNKDITISVIALAILSLFAFNVLGPEAALIIASVTLTLSMLGLAIKILQITIEIFALFTMFVILLPFLPLLPLLLPFVMIGQVFNGCCKEKIGVPLPTNTDDICDCDCDDDCCP